MLQFDYSFLPATKYNDHDRCLMSLAPLPTDGRCDLLLLFPCLALLPTSPILSSPFAHPSISALVCNRRGSSFNAGNDCIYPYHDLLEIPTIGHWQSCSLGITLKRKERPTINHTPSVRPHPTWRLMLMTIVITPTSGCKRYYVP